MNTIQVRCFLTVAEEGSVSRAAESLFLAQPSISRYLSQLEEEWGVRLFVRSGKRMVLTPEGEDYYRLCTRLNRDLADLRRKHLEDPTTARYQLSYSVFPAWNVTALLRSNAERIQKKYPNWEITLKICRAEILMDALRSGEVDVIFYVESLLTQYQEFEIRHLRQLPQAILYSVSDPLAGKKDLAPADFRNRDFLYVPDTVLTPEVMDRQVRSIRKRYGFDFRPKEMENVDALTMALEAGHGVALMDLWSRYLDNQSLTALELDLPLQVGLAWYRDSPNPAIAPFVEETASYLAEA